MNAINIAMDWVNEEFANWKIHQFLIGKLGKSTNLMAISKNKCEITRGSYWISDNYRSDDCFTVFYYILFSVYKTIVNMCMFDYLGVCVCIFISSAYGGHICMYMS
jgi:hypothetical protein